jgi:heat shock protein HslJ
MSIVMKNIRFSSVAFILAALLTSACSESPANPTSPSAGAGSPALTTGQLIGTWTLSSLQPAGQAAQAAPGGYTISFADGRVSTRVDCNQCSGVVSVSGQTLTVGPNLACTRAACATMAFESLYTSILGGDHTVEVSGTTLVLSSARGRLAFTQ